ncbi:MAG TPA: hypothetical protein VJ862_05710 [Rhodanobacteraceae bacterium]|nr:hypothetical protein [Rhodanobacteraceae bacterium]
MMMMTDGDLCTLRFRFDGEAERVLTLLEMMRSMDNVDRVVEVGTDIPHMRDDSSSAGLSDDTGGDFHDVEVHAVDRDAAEHARDLVEIAARDLGLVVEYVDRF